MAYDNYRNEEQAMLSNSKNDFLLPLCKAYYVQGTPIPLVLQVIPSINHLYLFIEASALEDLFHNFPGARGCVIFL